MVGAVNNVPAAGFTVASENPVYVHGNFNATTTDAAAEPNVATSIIADAITLLSNNFVDGSTFRFPNDATQRNATETGYRFAMITGKALPFAYPGWGVTEWGSDGGVHNFMRMLEDWSGQNLRYRGSMVSLWFGRQAIGVPRRCQRLLAADSWLQLRCRLPDPGVAAAWNAGVPRHQHAEVPADPAAESVGRSRTTASHPGRVLHERPRPESCTPRERSSPGQDDTAARAKLAPGQDDTAARAKLAPGQDDTAARAKLALGREEMHSDSVDFRFLFD